jgi:hypothetical protein
MKRAPFGTVAGLCQLQLSLPLDLPSLKIRVGLLVWSLELIPGPCDFAMSISADPSAVDIHVDIYFDITLHVNCDV